MQSNTVSAIHHLKLAHEHFSDFQRQHKGTKGAKIFENYKGRIEYIYRDLITHRFFTPETIEGIKQEWNSDVFALPAIADKVSLLTPEQRDGVEQLIDALLSGEQIIVEQA